MKRKIINSVDCRGYWQQGRTLIEMMIAIVIGLLIMITLVNFYLSSKQSYRATEASQGIDESGRLVLTMIGQRVRMAGYINPIIAGNQYAQAKAATWSSGSYPVYACNNGASNRATIASNLICGGAGTTDVLEINYDLLGTSTTGGLDLNLDCNGDDPTTSGYVRSRYFVDTDNALKCIGNGGGSKQPLIENVLDFQVQLGVDNNGDGVIDQVVDPAATVSWDKVKTVQVCLIAKASQISTAGQTVSWVDCSGNLQTSTDGYLRKRFVSTMTRRNTSY